MAACAGQDDRVLGFGFVVDGTPFYLMDMESDPKTDL